MPDTVLPPLIAALLDPAAYPHRPSSVTLRQTHISWVLLAGERVYKLKKPVSLGFVDYSTPARRAYYCRREVELNRRSAPEVYLSVVRLVEREGAVRVGGRGRLLDHAVEMTRLPDDGMLPALLARDAATPALMQRIATRVAEFHAGAAHGPRVARLGGPAATARTIANNLANLAPYVGRSLSAERHAYLADWTRAALDTHRPLMRARQRAGRVRDGHGDLHAANICITDRVVLFDCIEFSAALRCNDVAAEVAFLAMDLDRHGRADLAMEFLDAYMAESDDRALQPLLPLQCCARALVRGLVASIAMDDRNRTAEERAEQARLARGYLDLAYHAYAGGSPRPLLLLLGGLPASGKSTLARALAGRLALVHLNSDVLRKRRAGLVPTARTAPPDQAALYSAAANAATYAALLDEARGWLRRGVSVALDASFRRAADRAAAIALAEELGVPWFAVECRCAPAVARARLAARAADSAAVSDADQRVYELLAAEWEPWSELPVARQRQVDTGGDLEAALQSVLTFTAGERPALAPEDG